MYVAKVLSMPPLKTSDLFIDWTPDSQELTT